MSMLHLISIILALTGLSSWFNAKYIKLPNNIGILLVSTALSFALVILNMLGFYSINGISKIFHQINFDDFILHGILSILLFAGSIHVDINKLKSYKLNIGLFTTFGVIVSTIVTGYVSYFISLWLGLNIPLIYCLIFGALIAPTDPVAVLSILNDATDNEPLKAKLTGESLFNDGTGIVLFMLLLGLATGGDGDFSFKSIDYLDTSVSLIKEIIGGGLIGWVSAMVVMRVIKSIDNYQSEVVLTIALAIGSFSLAEIFHASAPIATVVAGLYMGNGGMDISMNDKTKEHVSGFWSLLDEILNSILFFLIGLEMVIISIELSNIVLGVVGILAVLVGRYFSVLGSALILKAAKKPINLVDTPLLMTWAGLRGGISVALALSLPESDYKAAILTITFMVVVFSIITQGLTLPKVVKFIEKDSKERGQELM